MILYQLRCRREHSFEAWFRDSAAFDKQRTARAITCPECGDWRIGKAPMAPRIGKRVAEEPSPKDLARAHKALGELRKHVESTCDYVGDRFPDEARKIHYGESEKRNIYGEATDQESRSLHEEGVEFHRVPWLPRHDS